MYRRDEGCVWSGTTIPSGEIQTWQFPTYILRVDVLHVVCLHGAEHQLEAELGPGEGGHLGPVRVGVGRGVVGEAVAVEGHVQLVEVAVRKETNQKKGGGEFEYYVGSRGALKVSPSVAAVPLLEGAVQHQVVEVVPHQHPVVLVEEHEAVGDGVGLGGACRDAAQVVL